MSELPLADEETCPSILQHRRTRVGVAEGMIEQLACGFYAHIRADDLIEETESTWAAGEV